MRTEKFWLTFFVFVCAMKLFAQENGPLLVFDSAEYNFGTLVQGQRVRHTFHFANKGKEPLHLISAKAPDKSIAVDCPREPVAPGQTGEIHFSFFTQGQLGDIAKVITIESDSRDGPHTFLQIIGTVNAIPTDGDAVIRFD